MIYSDYKDAAERHLETCLQLEYILKQEYKKKEDNGVTLTARLKKEKKQILADLYYLAGYIIECSYNCAVYKNIGWTGPVDRLRLNSTPYGVSCFPEPRALFVMRRVGSGLKQHQLSGNMHFFQTIRPLASVSTILLIGLDISSRLSFDLFDNWNAEIRYLVDSSLILEYDNVFDFLELATEVYEGLLINSMI
jgi:hypothetical protein